MSAKETNRQRASRVSGAAKKLGLTRGRLFPYDDWWAKNRPRRRSIDRVQPAKTGAVR